LGIARQRFHCRWTTWVRRSLQCCTSAMFALLQCCSVSNVAMLQIRQQCTNVYSNPTSLFSVLCSFSLQLRTQ
jgi:hypothetical protein